MYFVEFVTHNFRNKLLLSFTTLILLTVGGILLIVNGNLDQASESKIEQEMLVTANVLKEFRRTQLKTYSDASAALIRYNPQLRATLAEYNQSAEDLFGEEEAVPQDKSQIFEDIVRDIALFQQSHIFIITNGVGDVLYQKGGKTLLGSNLNTIPVIQTALLDNELFTWWGAGSPIVQEAKDHGMTLFEVFLKPVTFGQDVVGLLIIGFALDKRQLELIKNITLSNVAFYQTPHIYGSSAPGELNKSLENIVSKAPVEQGKSRISQEGPLSMKTAQSDIFHFTHHNEAFMALIHRVSDALENQVGDIIIFRSKTEEMRFFQQLSNVLNGIGAIAFAVGIMFALVISRGVVRAVRSLSQGTEAIRKGDLNVELPVYSEDELGQLAKNFNSMTQGLREKEHIKSTFKKYVSSSVVDEVLNSGVELGGERKLITIYFSDIADFTPISESMSPEELISFLNQYLTQMTRLLEKHSGVVDKYIGDAIMAFWGAPMPIENHAERSCLTALEQQTWHEAFRNSWSHNPLLSKLITRIGIHTGDAIIGNVGSEERMDYTIIGDAVNVASRLEALNKFYGTKILITEATKKQTGDLFLTREVDLVQVKGKNEILRIFELLDRSQNTTAEQKNQYNDFERGIELYRTRKFKESLELFQKYSTHFSYDHLADIYIQRCQECIEHPPDASWQGVQTMLRK